MTHARFVRRRGHAYFWAVKDKLPQQNAHFRNTPLTTLLKHCNRPTCEVTYLRVAQNGLKHREQGVNMAGNSGCVLPGPPRKRATPAEPTSKRQFPRLFIMGAKRTQLAHAPIDGGTGLQINRITKSFHSYSKESQTLSIPSSHPEPAVPSVPCP